MKIEYDSNPDVLTIEGMKYTGDLFRMMAFPIIGPPGLFRIVSRADGVLTIETIRKVYVLHHLAERDSDTGHDQLFVGEVDGVFGSREAAEDRRLELMRADVFAKISEHVVE